MIMSGMTNYVLFPNVVKKDRGAVLGDRRHHLKTAKENSPNGGTAGKVTGPDGVTGKVRSPQTWKGGAFHTPGTTPEKKKGGFKEGGRLNSATGRGGGSVGQGGGQAGKPPYQRTRLISHGGGGGRFSKRR